ncbi:MAG: serine phosphatase RsbU (regulator of sigma subunit)/tetratricopeptide (TPR) repeat protein [Arenicella sp.]|jgi:serine phosphatase RsbU (regulator of sigma subunit)/tetratricopeptide (TPR) repeat protein
MRSLLTGCVFIISSLGFAQLPEQVHFQADSVENIINTSDNDTLKTNSYFDWAAIVRPYDPNLDIEILKWMRDFCLEKLEEDLSEEIELFYHQNHGLSLNALGIISGRQQDYDQSFIYYEQSVEVYIGINEIESAANVKQNIGRMFDRNSEFDNAVYHYKEALELYRSTGNKEGCAAVLNNLAIVYSSQGKERLAHESYSISMQIVELDTNLAEMARLSNNIGNLYKTMGDFESALFHFQRSIELKRELENWKGVGTSLGNLGALFMKMELFDSALVFFNESDSIFKTLDEPQSHSSTLNNLANLHIQFDQLDSAEQYALLALKLRRQENFAAGVSSSLNTLAQIELIRKNYNKAKTYCIEAFEIAEEIGSVVKQKEASKILYQIFKIEGNSSKALEMYETHILMRDSLVNEENTRAVVSQQYEYEYETKTKTDSIRNEQVKEVAEANFAKKNAELKAKNTQQIALFIGLLVVAILGGIIYRKLKVTRKQKEVISQQKLQVEEKNKEILDSIHYAKRLQDAILPVVAEMEQKLKNLFVIYLPKDIVAGDFYWLETVGDDHYIAAADCTGHGVPGAMVSVVCSNALSKSLLEDNKQSPATILGRTRELVIRQFEKGGGTVKDGMDISLAKINLKTGACEWAGANNPIWIVRDGLDQLEEIKADKQPIGKFVDMAPFTNHSFLLNPGDQIYMFSDGFADQFGGEKGKKLKSKNLKNMVVQNSSESIKKQEEILTESFNEWMGEFEQLDDVCMIGFKMS